MKLDKIKILIFLLIIITFTSCKTYYISTSSMKEQFKDIDSTKFQLVQVQGPIGETYNYLANPIKSIKCVDKQNNYIELTNSPSIETRITENTEKKTILYFDRIYVSDSLLYGIKSRFIPTFDKIITLKNIIKIEVQDGKKNFKYKSN